MMHEGSHQEAASTAIEPHEAANARIGLGLFAVYVVLYAGFMALSAFARETMAISLGGVNLATWYGFGLILAALALALVYMALCKNAPAPHGSAEGGR